MISIPVKVPWVFEAQAARLSALPSNETYKCPQCGTLVLLEQHKDWYIWACDCGALGSFKL